ncbi:NADP-dependent oxidoreductase domain-containing protein [Microdochium trichocladiopsis]|uniref:NADP-dependent oxidoreductase domain-containing protein n=1 Tax=Microdochium trichocladiopsis TaxID=1682393 RepID=A0A9P9BLD3_9PEZI|nr:NADP-dependent oxidoreductase domain-containing protein [Microdochium trichocladiopsis]KAH7021597.1 NADP-dependent oxidoreductase domain-containing protein [Microdochium trichocladiopsis]
MEQPKYNALDREKVELEYAHLFRENGMGLTVWSPLAQGILTGKYKDGIPDDSRFAQNQVEFIAGYWKRTGKSDWDQVVQRVNKLQPIADELGVKLSALALAWVLKNHNVSTAITGASSPAQVLENVKAIEVIDKLAPEIMDKIDKILENKPPAVTPRF